MSTSAEFPYPSPHQDPAKARSLLEIARQKQRRQSNGTEPCGGFTPVGGVKGQPFQQVRLSEFLLEIGFHQTGISHGLNNAARRFFSTSIQMHPG